MSGWSDPLADPEAPDPLVMAMMVGAADPLDALAAYLARPAWHAVAACRGVGPDVFFIERGGSPAPAKALCEGCPAREPCRAAGHGEPGIWGGTSERERRQIRSRSAPAA